MPDPAASRSSGQPEAQGTAPSISMPKAGGAISGLGEKFEVNAVNGTSSYSIPIRIPAGRGGLTPPLSLQYDTGAGAGVFGFGWAVPLPAITRKTDKGLPRYDDRGETDTFVLSGAEDLVRLLDHADGGWQPHVRHRRASGRDYLVQRYRPRVETGFTRIERWIDRQSRETHWRTIDPRNVTSIYGRTANARIADPENPARCFSWLICETYDDAGNAIAYDYEAEDGAGVDVAATHEAGRMPAQRAAQRYVKRVRYGNRHPARDCRRPDEWLFEVVFDYGDHRRVDPMPLADRPWPCRADPFSSYRATFELRTYRLCQRILVFHHFPEEESVGADCLVRSLDLAYRGDPVHGEPRGAFLAAATQQGYRRRGADDTVVRSVPPIEFRYTEARLHGAVRDVDPASIANLPEGAAGDYRWLDLDGEGLPGILAEQDPAWYYLRNLGQARFAPAAPLQTMPSSHPLATNAQQFMDVNGDGRIELVTLTPDLQGFHERTEHGWAAFRPFRESPQIDWTDPDIRWIDLDGDGLSDVLVTREDGFIWYHARGIEGFATPQRVFAPSPGDDRAGPQLMFADPARAIYLADMSGDGLSDLVRIRNGEVSYWPNTGYGRFGARVTMDDAPWFDTPDLFDQNRIRLADIDGTGATDIVYLGRDGATIWFNEQGNRWSAAERLPAFPDVDPLAQVAAVDLLGNGTTCLVWSTAAPAGARRPMRFIDLMGGSKPHLLERIHNTMGAERRIEYGSSTRFYLADRAAGRPWATRLPFPVQVVTRVDTLDRVARNRFRSAYRYRHGFHDRREREFRGFGMVEQVDTEHYGTFSDEERSEAHNIDPASHIAPILTRTWYHVGQWDDTGRPGRKFERDYHQEPGFTTDEAEATALPPSRLPADLWPDEQQEAHRALKGAILRREVYADDGSDRADRPYSVLETNYEVRRLQPRGPNRHAAYVRHTRETLDLNYERAVYDIDGRPRADPLVSHSIALELDAFGNLLSSVSIAYGRRYPDPTVPEAGRRAQGMLRAGLDLTRHTNLVDTDEAYRLPVAAEARSYELYNLRPSSCLTHATNLLRFDETACQVRAAGDGDHDLPYADHAVTAVDGGAPFRRLIEHHRTRYRRDDLAGPLPLGVQEPLGLPYDSHTLALTPELLHDLLGDRVTHEMLGDAGYVRIDGHLGWWKPSGRVFYSPDPDAGPAAERAFARSHFFAQHRFEDPFGARTTVAYDRYTLLVQETRDALGNLNTAGERDRAGALVRQGNDYRVLQPWLAMDANRNRTEAAFDALGVMVATALRGKPEEDRGDTLAGFDPDRPVEATLAHLADPLAAPAAILHGATTCMLYDLFGYARAGPASPAVRYTLARTVHRADEDRNGPTGYQHAFTYSDGFNRDIQKKAQAEPGPLTPDGEPLPVRWIASGWTVTSNKGDPVRQYEPFFTAGPRFEFGRRIGVSSILLYDPASRVVARVHPNHSFEKVVLDPWGQTSWDVNDTVLLDPARDPDVGDAVRRLPESDYLPTWFAARQNGTLGPDERDAARKAAAHADTPSRAVADAMGRTILAITHNRLHRDGEVVDERYATTLEIDFEGNRRQVIDAKGRLALRADFDMAGTRLRSVTADSAARRELTDVTGHPVFAWDGRGHRLRTSYDALRRPRHIHLSINGEPETLVTRTEYGEDTPDAERRNLRTRTHRTFDGAGIASADEYDFKGNIVRSSRQLLRDVRTEPDWNRAPELEDEIFDQRTIHDALDRPMQLVPPHPRGGTVAVVQPAYNVASLLERVAVWRGRDAVPAGPLDPAAADLQVIASIDYDAKGQRARVSYGNGAHTRYRYDPLMFRLVGIATARDDPAKPLVQDLHYVHDPAGNIMSIRDRSQPAVWFRGRQVEADATYTYDAVYRLVEANGREHLGQQHPHKDPRGARDRHDLRPPHPGEASAFAPYRETYGYDEVGNILELLHRRQGGHDGDFRRRYDYREISHAEPGGTGNRLSATRIGDTIERYAYDAAGNAAALPQLAELGFNYRDQLRRSVRQATGAGEPETTWYVYDAHGRRMRKVTTRAAHDGAGPRRRERIYLDGFEIHRDYQADGETIRCERTTLHVADGERTAALVERRARGEDKGPADFVRFQHQNHLSTVLELDEEARLISYEEYYPYGGSAFRLTAAHAEAPKRYRYNNKERDRETGLYYYGSRYYAPWLGRWISCDPSFQDEWPNPYSYTRDNPVIFSDPDGAEESSNWNRFLGAVKVIGGGIQATVGAAVFVQIEVPVAAQVVGGVAVAHGVDDMWAGAKQVISGKEEHTFTQQIVAGTAKAAGMEEHKAEALGTGVDIAAGFISPAPITGAGKGAVAITVNAPRLQVLQEAGTGLGKLSGGTKAVEITVDATKAATAGGVLQATALVAGGGGGGGGKKNDGNKEGSKTKEAPKSEPREVKTLISHTGGNKQVAINGQRWNLPKGVDAAKLPGADKVGDQLQAATKTAASQWKASKLTIAEREAIRAARAEGEGWRANLLQQQARGRWIEKQVKQQFPNLQWQRAGVDAIDPATGLKYDILSGSKWNMDLHAKRMADQLFRMITF